MSGAEKLNSAPTTEAGIRQMPSLGQLPVPKMLCPLFYLRVRSQEPKHNVLYHGYKGSYGGERRQSMAG